MFETFLVIGLGCVIAAIVGGGLKIANFEVPIISSLPRQLLLAAVGVAIVAGDVAFVGREAAGNNDEHLLEAAELVLSEPSGPPGASLTTSGRGFGARETVRIRFHNEEIATAQADAAGRFAGKTIEIPRDWTGDGQWEVTAVGESSGQATSRGFRVPPARLKLSQGKGPAGTALKVTGQSFAAGETVDIAAHLTPVGRAKANGDGVFSTRIKVPRLGPPGFDDLTSGGSFPLDIEATGETSRRVAHKTFVLLD